MGRFPLPRVKATVSARTGRAGRRRTALDFMAMQVRATIFQTPNALRESSNAEEN